MKWGIMETTNLSELAKDTCLTTMLVSFIQMYKGCIIPKDEEVFKFIDKYLPECKDFLLLNFDDIKNEKFAFESDGLLSINDKYNDIIKETGEEITENIMKDVFHNKKNMGVVKELLKDKFKLIEDIIDEAYSKREKDTDKYRKRMEPYNYTCYNPCLLLMSIDRNLGVDDDYVIYNAEEKYEEAFKCISEKLEGISMISLGVSSLAIEMNQAEGTFCGSDHYNSSSNLIELLKNMRSIEFVKAEDSKSGEAGMYFVEKRKIRIIDILQLMSLNRIQKQLALQKILIAMHFILISSEYFMEYDSYSYEFINTINELMHCGLIHKIYIQEGDFDKEIDIDDRGANEHTTRMSIIFSLQNSDIYIARIDLPHKGEPNLHINVEEIKGTTVLPTGYPVKSSEISNLRENCEDIEIEEFFFFFNNYYWFRSNFESLITKSTLCDNDKKILSELFRKQSHKYISCDGDYAVNYMNELKKYLYRFGVEESRFLSFVKDDIDYANEIAKIRALIFAEIELQKMVIDEPTANVSTFDVLETFAKISGQSHKVPEEYSRDDILQIWELIRTV